MMDRRSFLGTVKGVIVLAAAPDIVKVGAEALPVAETPVLVEVLTASGAVLGSERFRVAASYVLELSAEEMVTVDRVRTTWDVLGTGGPVIFERLFYVPVTLMVGDTLTVTHTFTTSDDGVPELSR